MISREDVLHIAKLANLTLTEEEIPLYQKWLSEALSYVEILDELDTTKAAPTYQVTNLKGVYREDIEDTAQHLTRREALANIPLTQEDGYFGVPKIKWE